MYQIPQLTFSNNTESLLHLDPWEQEHTYQLGGLNYMRGLTHLSKLTLDTGMRVVYWEHLHLYLYAAQHYEQRPHLHLRMYYITSHGQYLPANAFSFYVLHLAINLTDK